MVGGSGSQRLQAVAGHVRAHHTALAGSSQPELPSPSEGGVLQDNYRLPGPHPVHPTVLFWLVPGALGCGCMFPVPGWGVGWGRPPPQVPLHGCICLFPLQGEGLHQLREALKILAERVLILETMIGLYGE